MPIFLEPDQRFPIVLDSDEGKPIETRPTFFAKSLNMRGQLRLSAEMDDALSKLTAAEIFESTCKLISEYVVGWKNMGSFEFGCDVKEFLSHSEAREVLRKVLANQHVPLEEKS